MVDLAIVKGLADESTLLEVDVLLQRLPSSPRVSILGAGTRLVVVYFTQEPSKLVKLEPVKVTRTVTGEVTKLNKDLVVSLSRWDLLQHAFKRLDPALNTGFGLVVSAPGGESRTLHVAASGTGPVFTVARSEKTATVTIKKDRLTTANPLAKDWVAWLAKQTKPLEAAIEFGPGKRLKIDNTFTVKAQ